MEQQQQPLPTRYLRQLGMSVGMAVVRPTNASDPFLLSWTKDAANPINFTSGALTTPYDTPGQVWKNGDHWNYVILGVRYTTKDPTLHTWGVAPGPKFMNLGENGGQWFSKLANLRDDSPPPASAPGWMVNDAGGNKFALGEYYPGNETWVTTGTNAALIDAGPDSNWMVGQFAGKRFMNIGWSLGGPPMEVADYPEEHDRAYAQGLLQTTTTASVSATTAARSHSRPTTTTTSAAAAYAATGCQFTTHWDVYNESTNIYNRMPSPTNVTHGTLHFIGLFDSAQACFAAVNASKEGPFNSFTYNDATLSAPYGRHCWADTSMTWQNRVGGYKGQVSGRGAGFPITPPIPSSFTHDHLTGLREVAYDPVLKTLVSNPVRELVNLRNGTLAHEPLISLTAGETHIVAGTGLPRDASTADVLVNFTLPTATTAVAGTSVGVRVLSNVTSDGDVYGGILLVANFTQRDTNGTMHALASIRTLNPCGTGSEGVTQVSFPMLKGETTLTIRVLVDRSVVEAFVMDGRAVFSKTYFPTVLYVPDTNIALHVWGTASNSSTITTTASGGGDSDIDAAVDVYSMGCGWNDPPYQPNPTLQNIM